MFDGESEHSEYGIGPATHWRWDEDAYFIHEAIDIYAKVYPNLSVHANDYPHPDELRSKIYDGNVEFPGDIIEFL